MNVTNVNISECSQSPMNGTYFYDTAQFITGLFIYPILCFPGIIGNILSLIVLFHKDMATSTNVYLSALAISDTVKLINDVLYFIVILMKHTDAEHAGMVMAHLYPYAHYIFNFAVCATAWLTVSIAVERYISVCYPVRAKTMCTIPRARNICICVYIVMIIITIPSALRYKAVFLSDHTLNVTCYGVKPTTLGNNKYFMVPYTWIQNSFRSIVPLLVLIFLNARIIHELKRERIKGKTLSGRNRITLIMIIIIIVFLVCITPDAVMSMFFGFGYVEEDNFVKGIREITDTLLAANSAFNFVLYCTLSQQFRGTFYKIFGVGVSNNRNKRVEHARLLASGDHNNHVVRNGRTQSLPAKSSSSTSSVQEETQIVPNQQLQETFV